VYITNESASSNWVYFDDMQVKIKQRPVIQVDDYYPFGLTFNKYRRSTAKENKLNTFQDQELITDLDLNWVQFKWRNHDPAIGRFFNIDPLAEKFYYNSPYAFSENKVINGIEMEGLEFVPIQVLQAGTEALDNYLTGQGLNAEEKKIVLDNPSAAYKSRGNRELAKNFAGNAGIKNHLSPMLDDEGDALRHVMLGALNTQTGGADFAKKIGDAHEDGSDNTEAQKTMDKFNNDVGINLGKENPDATPKELMQMAIDRLQNGELFVLKPFNPTDETIDRAKKNVESLYEDGDDDIYEDNN
jgi:RHS repeat-associated protein